MFHTHVNGLLNVEARLMDDLGISVAFEEVNWGSSDSCIDFIDIAASSSAAEDLGSRIWDLLCGLVGLVV